VAFWGINTTEMNENTQKCVECGVKDAIISRKDAEIRRLEREIEELSREIDGTSSFSKRKPRKYEED
jgi:transcription initiation factor IIE alpha subunit